MVDRRELISVLRQIGIMMGAGVDFLQITAVLHAQTEDPRLLRLYDALDHDLTMGVSLADAMARQPDIFSPFAVSLVRQIEMRNEMAEMAQELAGAFHKIADYLQQDAALTRESGRGPTSASNRRSSARPTLDVARSAAGQPLTTHDLDHALNALRRAARRGLGALAALCGVVAAIYLSAALGLLDPRWLAAAVWCVVALGLGAATLRLSPGMAAPAPHDTHGVTEPQGADSGEPALDVWAGDGPDDSDQARPDVDWTLGPAAIRDGELAGTVRNWADMRGLEETYLGGAGPDPVAQRAPRLANGRREAASVAQATVASLDGSAAGTAVEPPRSPGEAEFE